MTKIEGSPTLLRKPRYADESEIIALIDAKKAKAVACEKESWELDRERQRLLEESAKLDSSKSKDWIKIGELVKEAEDCRRRSIKLRRKAELILDKHLPELKNKLAEMRTGQIPALDNGDLSIPR